MGLVRCLNDILPTPRPPNPPERRPRKGQELGSWNVTVSSAPGTEPGVWQRVKERPPRTEALTSQLRVGQERRGLGEGKWFFLGPTASRWGRARTVRLSNLPQPLRHPHHQVCWEDRRVSRLLAEQMSSKHGDGRPRRRRPHSTPYGLPGEGVSYGCGN